MRILYLLGIAIITFLLNNSFMIGPKSQIKETPKNKINLTAEDWEKLHMMIERSSVDIVKADFEQFISNNLLKTNGLNCKDGKYFGLTPADDYGYYHLVYLEIIQGKITNIHYDELKSNGKNKRTDINYNLEMLKSGTLPSIAYPVYEQQLIKKQDYMKVDAVTGATYSLYRFRMAVAKALEKATDIKPAD